MIVIVKVYKGAKASSLEKVSYGKKETKWYPVLPPLPRKVKKATTLLSNELKIMPFAYQRWNSLLIWQIKKKRGIIHTIGGKAVCWTVL